ncbi:ATP-binding protein [Limosilactobacillus ingluviei]|uniref:ATP-binding protein n=1 Tax=Limosilactobacillus ingluviei TaxID=148604 RepID=UPI0024B9CFC7|nr:ATP-binding protein [Limosilactobacillus ingluviei]
MNINEVYQAENKSYYYLGLISQVFQGNAVIQVENLSLLSYRRIRNEAFVPNTINFYVLVDAENGMFLGKVFQSKLPNNETVHQRMNRGQQDNVYPELSIDIVGYIPYEEDQFTLPGMKTVGIGDKVYLANQAIMAKFAGSYELGQGSEPQMEAFAKIDYNGVAHDLKLQPKTLFDHHLMTIGTTNSGKSTSALAILDKAIEAGIKVLIIDPTGEYSETFSDYEIDKCTLGEDAFVSPASLTDQQWSSLFGTNNSSQPALLHNAIRSLRYIKKCDSEHKTLVKHDQPISVIEEKLESLTDQDLDFDLENLPEQIMEEAVAPNTKKKYEKKDFNLSNSIFLEAKVSDILKNTQLLEFFNSKSTENGDLFKTLKYFCHGKRSLYINSSRVGTGDSIGATIIDLISRNIIAEEIETPFVIFIDEVHRYTKDYEESGLTLIAREGRKRGIFLFLTTQSPNDVNPTLLGQVGTMLIHRLTSFEEINTISNHITTETRKLVTKLNTGEAILASVNLADDLVLKVAKSSRKHNNATPSLVTEISGSTDVGNDYVSGESSGPIRNPEL